MKFLLDTNVCIGLLKGKESLLNRFKLCQRTTLYSCSVVRAELIFRAYRSQYPNQNLRLINTFLEPFISLPFDDQCAEEYGQLRSYLAGSGKPIGPNDLLIASIALTHQLTLVTHNTREFERVPGLLLEDWEQ